jgi:4-diphosphocytidyl-2-C-methyl-D-erythritol kinase
MHMTDLQPRPDADGAWLAPAKLNLMLRVLGRRADGYHRLQTVFQFIDRADRLRFARRHDARVVRVHGADGVPPEQDLVVRAAQALRAETGCDYGVEIELDKVLPMGGGLGGGSWEWELGLSTDSLAHIGLRLGADVPVFVRGRAAWAEGVGEEMVAVSLPEPWYLVLVPPVAVSTAAVFNDPDLTRDSLPITMESFVAGNQVNDCLPVVRRRYPAVAAAFDWLSDVGAVARLTGTGACVFGRFPTEADARAVLAHAPAGLSAFVARGCNRSPLFG